MKKYTAYKLSFKTGVHFGNGILNDTKSTFCADTLFSALCIEALKDGLESLERLYKITKEGRLLFSDGFPFIEETLYIPKPILTIEHDSEDISRRKVWKGLTYIPLEKITEFLSGQMDAELETEKLKKLGNTEMRQLVSLQKEEKSEPYTVGIYHYFQNNGIYFILGYEDDLNKEFVENLLHALSYQGLGGKISSGLGKFSFNEYGLPQHIIERLNAEAERFIVLSASLPREDELESVIESAKYLLVKRSGFIQSCQYSEELVKKRDMYFLKSGSVVYRHYKGDIYNVGTRGNHPVWRYGKPILLEV